MRTVHILGGNGFIGSRLAADLLRRGHRVTVGGRPRDGTDGDTVEGFRRLLEDHDWIVHAASDSTPSSTANRPLAEVNGNLRTRACLVEATQSRAGARILYLSSAGTTYSDAPSGHPVEEDALSPRSFHGAGKVAAEQFLRVLAGAGGCQVTVVRPSNVYGPGQLPRPGFGLISTALARCLDGLPLPIFGDGSSTRDYLYVDDASDLLVRIIGAPYQAGFDVFNAAHGQGHSLREVLELAEKVTGRPLVRDFRPARQVDARCVVPDPRKAKERFGWQSTTSLAAGMAETWKWLQDVLR